jgi:hypothetical protein
MAATHGSNKRQRTTLFLFHIIFAHIPFHWPSWPSAGTATAEKNLSDFLAKIRMSSPHRTPE